MSLGVRVAAAGIAALATACLLTSCGSGPTAAHKKAVHRHPHHDHDDDDDHDDHPADDHHIFVDHHDTARRCRPQRHRPQDRAAHAALRAAGFLSVNLNKPCNKGTVASQSVVASLAIPGKSPDVRVGATPLSPARASQPGTLIGINWSGCFGDASAVPAVVGLPFPAARRAIHAVGLTWACFSVGPAAATTTTRAPRPTSTSDTSTTTTAPETTTTVKVVQTVLTQSPAANTVLHPGTTVTLTMHRCPQ